MRKNVVNSYINKYTKELINSIIEIEPKLIEAFVTVYGEEHRDFITHIITNMDYIFFISEKFCSILKENKNLSKKELYIFNLFLKYLKQQDYLFNCVNANDEAKFIIDKYLPLYPFKLEDYAYYKNSLESDCPCCSLAFYESSKGNYTKFYICLPIFTIDLKTIIHEINHALNIKALGYTSARIITDTLFKNEYSEELVNVYEMLGGIIPKPLRRIKIGNEYVYKDYIVEYLFSKLVDIILESRISGNFNLFYKKGGDYNVKQLDDLMNELYHKEEFDEELYNELISLIDKITFNIEQEEGIRRVLN